MAHYSASLFFLVCLAFLATDSSAAKSCPNKCLSSRKDAVHECKKGSRATLCTVKRCPGSRGWKCANAPKAPSPPPSTEEVSCKPVADPDFVTELLCGNLGCSPFVNIKKRLNLIACKCDGELFFNDGGIIVSDFSKNKDTKCFENCMKEKACLGGVCLPTAVSGSAFDQCVTLEGVLTSNVGNTDNQRDCCEACGGSLVFTTRGSDEFYVCM